MEISFFLQKFSRFGRRRNCNRKMIVLHQLVIYKPVYRLPVHAGYMGTESKFRVLTEGVLASWSRRQDDWVLLGSISNLV